MSDAHHQLQTKKQQIKDLALSMIENSMVQRQKCLNEEQISMLMSALRAGVAKARIARDLGVSRETVYRYLRN